jgi:hypothetical protein
MPANGGTVGFIFASEQSRKNVWKFLNLRATQVQ